MRFKVLGACQICALFTLLIGSLGALAAPPKDSCGPLLQISPRLKPLLSVVAQNRAFEFAQLVIPRPIDVKRIAVMGITQTELKELYDTGQIVFKGIREFNKVKGPPEEHDPEINLATAHATEATAIELVRAKLRIGGKKLTDNDGLLEILITVIRELYLEILFHSSRPHLNNRINVTIADVRDVFLSEPIINVFSEYGIDYEAGFNDLEDPPINMELESYKRLQWLARQLGYSSVGLVELITDLPYAEGFLLNFKSLPKDRSSDFVRTLKLSDISHITPLNQNSIRFLQSLHPLLQELFTPERP